MEQPRFEDLPMLMAKMINEISELKAIIGEKLTTPEGYEPDITMSPEEVAKYIGCTVQNIHKKKNTGQLPYYKVGRTIYFKKKDIDSASRIKQHRRKFFK